MHIGASDAVTLEPVSHRQGAAETYPDADRHLDAALVRFYLVQMPIPVPASSRPDRCGCAGDKTDCKHERWTEKS